MTNLELIRELAKPGRILMPVIGHHDVIHIEITKASLLHYLKQQPPGADAEWCFFGDDQDRPGDRWLDLQN